MKVSGEIGREELMDLSLDAAIEIERALLGQNTNEDVFKRMLAALSGTFRPAVNNQANFVDPRVVSIYGRAVKSMDDSETRTVQAVKDWISNFAARYYATEATAVQPDLSQLRDFLLALHRELVADVHQEIADTPLGARPSYDLASNSAFAG